MIGEKITVPEESACLAQRLVKILYPFLKLSDHKFVLSIAGESGSGKTTLAAALKSELEKYTVKTMIIHMDDYFLLPPKSNHQARLADLNHVGPQEVNLARLDEDLYEFKKGLVKLSKPLSNYDENLLTTEEVMLDNIDIMLVEGTYVSSLSKVDYKIFIDKNYQDTLGARKSRNRDILNDFGEQVLAIEHEIIKSHKENADFIITTDGALFTRLTED